MSSLSSDEYLYRLKRIDDELNTRDLQVLKFLCRDFVKGTAMDDIKSALDLFDKLESRKLISASDIQLIAECLYEAQRRDLMKLLNCPMKKLEELKSNHGPKLNPYRLMLHRLNESMLVDNVKTMKYHLRDVIGRARLEAAADAYSIFLELEQQAEISPTNVNLLLHVLTKIDEPQLVSLVEEYTDGHCRNAVARTQGQDTDTQCGPSLGVFHPTPMTAPEYPITTHPRGICLIINNEDFTDQDNGEVFLKNRNGSHRDLDSLKEVFQGLEFKVEVEENLTAAALRMCLKGLATRDHSAYSLFVCCLLSHGDTKQIYGTDGNKIPLPKLIHPFSSCPTLRDKPKLFFIQACQGSNVDAVTRQGEPDSLLASSTQYQATRRESPSIAPAEVAYNEPDPDDLMKSIPMRSVRTDGPSLSPVEESLEEFDDIDPPSLDPQAEHDGILGVVGASQMLPREADFFVGLAAVPGFTSFRNCKTGSWYIEALCSILKDFHNEIDLLGIMTMVNERVSRKNVRGQVKREKQYFNKQVPAPANTLRYRLYLRTEHNYENIPRSGATVTNT